LQLNEIYCFIQKLIISYKVLRTSSFFFYTAYLIRNLLAQKRLRNLFSIAHQRKRSAIAKSQRFADLAPAYAMKNAIKRKRKQGSLNSLVTSGALNSKPMLCATR